MLRKFSLVALVLAICGASIWHIHRVFHFDPLKFRHDHVTYDPWSYYKNPMDLDIVYQDFYADQFRYTTENRKEINYVISQLKAADLETTYNPSKDVNDGGQIWIQFRNPISGNDYIDAILRENMKVALLGQTYPTTITNGLKQFIIAKRKEAKIM